MSVRSGKLKNYNQPFFQHTKPKIYSVIFINFNPLYSRELQNLLKYEAPHLGGWGVNSHAKSQNNFRMSELWCRIT
jgi:hypothetical protein